jgi:hypothetical protein
MWEGRGCPTRPETDQSEHTKYHTRAHRVSKTSFRLYGPATHHLRHFGPLLARFQHFGRFRVGWRARPKGQGGQGFPGAVQGDRSTFVAWLEPSTIPKSDWRLVGVEAYSSEVDGLVYPLLGSVRPGPGRAPRPEPAGDRASVIAKPVVGRAPVEFNLFVVAMSKVAPRPSEQGQS